jgi:uncharacterized protein (DUF433 family)
MEEFDRITHNPAVMGGKACIRGMRVTAGMIVRQIGAGRTIDELLADYPYLEREDIHQALSYAARPRAGGPIIPTKWVPRSSRPHRDERGTSAP